MKKFLLLCFTLFLTSTIFSQYTSLEYWKNKADNDNQTISGSSYPSQGLFLQAVVKSNSTSDGYFEGFGVLYGLQRMWQASGDFWYLDKWFEIVESDIEGSFDEEFLAGYLPADAWRPYYWPYFGDQYRSNGDLKNYYLDVRKEPAFGGSFNYYQPDIPDYIKNANGKTHSYNFMAALYPAKDYYILPLHENIYYRFVADMLRILNHHSEVLDLTSNNGEKYRDRFNRVLEHVRVNIFEKWVEASTPQQKDWFVYRVNTHMSTHLGSIAVSLYSIFGDQKYLNFLNELLYDFGSAPESSSVPGGTSLMGNMEVMPNGSIVWSSSWGKFVTDGQQGQDGGHAGAEYHLFYQMYQEGLGLNPPPGFMKVDDTFMQGLVKTIMQNQLDGYECGDPIKAPRYRIAGTYQTQNTRRGHQFFIQGQMAYAEFDSDFLCYMSNNDKISFGYTGKQSYYGNGAYAAAVLNGTGPVYPDVRSGEASTSSNNCPTVTSKRGEEYTLNLGEEYSEEGGTWTDPEDGTGEAEISGDIVDTATPGVYNVIYSYTDLDGCTRSDTLTVFVVAEDNSCPTIEVRAGSSVQLLVGETYVEQGAFWVDEEDGTDEADVSGNVDTSTAGTYVIEYSYTDQGGCRTVESLLVTVIDEANNILTESFSFNVDEITVEVGFTGLASFEALPENRSIPFIWVQSSDESIAEVDPNGSPAFLRPGVVTITGTTLDGSNLTDSYIVNVIEREENSENIQISSFNWNEPAKVMLVGEIALPEFQIAPNNATNKIIWVQSNNTELAQINSNGAIIAREPGIVTIKGSTLDGSGITDEFQLQIIDKDSFYFVDGNSIEGESMKFEMGLNNTTLIGSVELWYSVDHISTDSRDLSNTEGSVILNADAQAAEFEIDVVDDSLREDSENFGVQVEFEGIRERINLGQLIGLIEESDNQVANESPLQFSPNPIRRGQPVTITGMPLDLYNLKVIDLSGKILKSTSIDLESPFIELNMDMQQSGLYILMLQSLDNTYIGKLIVN